MARLMRLSISPPLMNSSCAWASDEKQLRELYECEHTGAVTTRTATLDGFAEDPAVHTVAFSAEYLSSVNSYGYSPYPLSQYLSWIEDILEGQPTSSKPILVSITASRPAELMKMIEAIQQLRHKLHDDDLEDTSRTSRIGIELNTSCPNIADAPPPAYTPDALSPLLAVLAMSFWSDRTLTIGLKLPPYTHMAQFTEVLRVVGSLSREVDVDGSSMGNTDIEETVSRLNPIAFLTCTNTLGTSLLFADQVMLPTPTHISVEFRASKADSMPPSPSKSSSSPLPAFALPTPVGGLAGDALHALALGNVYTFSQLLTHSPDLALRRIALVGVGGVTNRTAADRMRRAGAQVVACATLLGWKGVQAFEILCSPRMMLDEVEAGALKLPGHRGKLYSNVISPP